MATPNVIAATTRTARHFLDVPTPNQAKGDVVSGRNEVARLVRGDLPGPFVQKLAGILREPLFDRHEGLTSSGAAELAYERARYVARSLCLTASELSSPLGEKPGYALDNAVTRFDGVRIPKAHLLIGQGSVLHDDGRFHFVQSGEAKEILSRMFLLWAVRVVERHAAWFLAEGSVTSAVVKGMEGSKDRLCAAIEPDARVLADAFDFDNAILRAPIAEEDYVRAYDPWPLDSERAS